VTRDHRRLAIVPLVWADFYQETGIPAAVAARGGLHVTGHTGTLEDGSLPDDAESQIRQTFRNLAITLAEAGASWADVVQVNSYHVGLQAQGDILLRVAAEFLAEPYPAWTAVGITELFEQGALVEISCIALTAD
jgi:enamine deaminase RidA (YjgF/YER057c/UK114 family)